MSQSDFSNRLVIGGARDYDHALEMVSIIESEEVDLLTHFVDGRVVFCVDGVEDCVAPFQIEMGGETPKLTELKPHTHRYSPAGNIGAERSLYRSGFESVPKDLREVIDPDDLFSFKNHSDERLKDKWLDQLAIREFELNLERVFDWKNEELRRLQKDYKTKVITQNALAMLGKVAARLRESEETLREVLLEADQLMNRLAPFNQDPRNVFSGPVFEKLSEDGWLRWQNEVMDVFSHFERARHLNPMETPESTRSSFLKVRKGDVVEIVDKAAFEQVFAKHLPPDGVVAGLVSPRLPVGGEGFTYAQSHTGEEERFLERVNRAINVTKIDAQQDLDEISSYEINGGELDEIEVGFRQVDGETLPFTQSVPGVEPLHRTPPRPTGIAR